MGHEKKIWAIAAGAACVLSAAAVHAYTYNAGPNWVNMSGARCRAETAALGDNLTHDVGRVTVNSGTTTRRLFCPITRRNTSTYGDTSGSQIDTKVNIEDLFVRARDQHGTRSLSCFAFASAVGTGATFFTATSFLCNTWSGCSSVASSWQGTSGMMLYGPFGSSRQSVNWGLACDVPGNSTLYYSETSLFPN